MSLKGLGEKSTLFVVSEGKYLSTLLNVVKLASRGNVCFVTLNKTCSALRELFKKHGINSKNIKTIDCITKSIQDVDNSADCTFISSPEAITELSIVLNTHLEYAFDYVIFDSMNALLTYTSADVVKKFMKSVVSKMQGTSCKVVIFALDTPEHSGVIKSVSTFVDEVVHSKR